MNEDEEALFGIDKLNVVRSEIPAVTHVDYSARIQTVHADTNPRYHRCSAPFRSAPAARCWSTPASTCAANPSCARPKTPSAASWAPRSRCWSRQLRAGQGTPGPGAEARLQGRFRARLTACRRHRGVSRGLAVVAMKVVHPGKPGQAVGCDTASADQEIARMNMHKNARLMPQGQLLLVQRVIEQGWTVGSAACAAGLSQRQAYRWLARYRNGGDRGADRPELGTAAASPPGAGRARGRDRAPAAAALERPGDRAPA